jgi:hypothetical protein
MTTEDNNQGTTEAAETTATEATDTTSTTTQDADTIAVPRSEYEKLNSDLGSLKREVKDLRKPKEAAPSGPDELTKKTFLRAAGISDKEEVELALKTADKWNLAIDELVDDDDFQEKLTKLRTKKANDTATSGITGRPGSGNATQTPEYWLAKGQYPSREEVPDRTARKAIREAFMKQEKGGAKKFYND